MDGLVPLASVPTQIAGRNRMLRKMISTTSAAIPRGTAETTPHSREAAEPARAGYCLFMVSSPLQWQKAAPTRDAADRFLDEQMSARLAGVDANDFLYASSFAGLRPSNELEKISLPFSRSIRPNDQVNPPELGLMEKLIPRVRRGQYVLIPTSEHTRGHGTHSFPAVWQNHLREFLAKIEPKR